MRCTRRSSALAAVTTVLLSAGMAVGAQVAPAPSSATAAAETAAAIAEPRALQAFVASYQVFNQGRALGTATMQVAPAPGDRWRVDLNLKGGGLLRVAGLNLQQSTVFEQYDNQYRPISQALLKRVFMANRKSVGVYDWSARSAVWTGDVKPSRRRPVPLQSGDMSGLLINLAVIRDAQPGRTLHYRFVDDGRARNHVYKVADATETIQVGELSYDAMRVERVQGGSEQTVLWVASGVPTPIRILQREDGEEATDLRLIQYS